MRVLPPFRIAVSAIACALLLAFASAAQQETPKPFPAHPSHEDRAAAAGWGKGTWLDQHERCKATAQRGGIDLVLLGDSITQGFGGPTRDVSQPAGDTLTRELDAWRAANMGISGDGVSHVLWRLQNGALDGLDPRFVALMIGTNDLSRGESPTFVADGTAACVREIRTRVPHAIVVVEPPIPRGKERSDAMRAKTDEAAKLVRERCGNDPLVRVLDLAPTFCDEQGTLVANLFASDLLHLSADGYRAWATALRGELLRLDATRQRHVAFVAGDDEYRSEESLPMLAALAARELGVRTTVCLPRNTDGAVDPSCKTHIDNLCAIDSADALVLFTRFRELPDDELRRITDHASLGRAMLGFRTSTHAFLYPEGSTHRDTNDAWPRATFGQKWITHHGHFDDGKAPLTDVAIDAPAKAHPILRGVAPFAAFSWLYHVDGGGDALQQPCEILLRGTALRSGHEDQQRFPRTQPVAWTKVTQREDREQRVFFTTLGHPYDFREEPMRRMCLQAIAWALRRDDSIPENGMRCEPASPFLPSNSGMGAHRR
jgi:lysophospholipase L1-like esterase/type 1 glutamine amidotransferase